MSIKPWHKTPYDVHITSDVLTISREAYERMLADQGIATLEAERKSLADKNASLELQIKENKRKITALTSTIAALHLVKGY